MIVRNVRCPPIRLARKPTRRLACPQWLQLDFGPDPHEGASMADFVSVFWSPALDIGIQELGGLLGPCSNPQARYRPQVIGCSQEREGLRLKDRTTR